MILKVGNGYVETNHIICIKPNPQGYFLYFKPAGDVFPTMQATEEDCQLLLLVMEEAAQKSVASWKKNLELREYQERQRQQAARRTVAK